MHALCAVLSRVTHVKVEDGNPLQRRVRLQSIARANGHVVEQAEALGGSVESEAAAAGVVAWRTGGDKGIAARACRMKPRVEAVSRQLLGAARSRRQQPGSRGQAGSGHAAAPAEW